MAVFKCKLCGGTIEVKDNGIGVCDSCGTKQTIPNTNDEKKMNLLDRANHFRMQNDFDKAMSIYEQVLEEDTTDSDIYYSIALCRYGITYVDDPKTKKKIPTINRMQNVKFTEDADFVMAVKYAEPEQARFYKEEGEYLDKVQQGIMDITKNEKPYDVFICYKETDDNGERTRDSVLANDLYHGLTNEGFKVFFARITLEGKLGVAYEPYIFAALQSSKVMVVLGTKKEYFNAVWVKNEWSRYISLMNEGANKTLIPAFRDMDPYDLPDEFSNLQALDMSKLGFMQDLIRGIKKIVVGTKETTPDKVDGSSDKVSSLLKRVKVFLDDGDFKKAQEYCEKALDINAEDSNVYLYKLMIENKCKSVEELMNTGIDFNDASTNFNKALKFANQNQENLLKEINNESLYRYAKSNISSGHDDTAINTLNKILDYKDSAELKEKYEERIRERNEQLRIEEEKKIEKRNRVLSKIFDIISTMIAIPMVQYICDDIRYFIEHKEWQIREGRDSFILPVSYRDLEMVYNVHELLAIIITFIIIGLTRKMSYRKCVIMIICNFILHYYIYREYWGQRYTILCIVSFPVLVAMLFNIARCLVKRLKFKKFRLYFKD